MIKKRLKEYTPLIILLGLMYLIHRYIFIYADDLYYSRDAKIGLSYLPDLMLKELNVNGRVWVHVLLTFLVRYDALLFRVVNPIIITLGALLISKIGVYNNKDRSIFPSAIITSLLFIALPTQIVSTTIYYAACSLNYFYPTIVSILFGYLLLKYYSNEENLNKLHIGIIIVAFFSASSTQQAGAIGIGFAVLITLYLVFIKKNRLKIKYYVNFVPLILGYSLVTFGSIKRMLLEKDSGVEIEITKTINEILKTNIFSKPVTVFILLISLSTIIWLIKYSKSNNNYFKYFNLMLSLGIFIASLCYIYVVILRGYEVDIFNSGSVSLKIKLFYIGFACLYLFSIIYSGILILIDKKNPFILSCIINAIGAQMMLIVADSRFASAYKIIFPSLLLMFIFITYTFTELYYENNIKLNKVLFCIITIVFSLISIKFFYNNYEGYKKTAVEINYNLEAIKEYNNSDDKSILKLKKVPPSLYGYNLGNWNNIPYFMKQCYKINEDTIIEYID